MRHLTKTARRRALAAALVGSAVACGGSSESSGGGLTAYATAFCAKIEPCCAMAKLPTDGNGCMALFELDEVFAAAAGVDASVVDPCTAAIQAEGQSAFCQDLGATLPACAKLQMNDDAGGAPSQGQVKPGGACTFDSDCAPSSAGTPTCVMYGSSATQSVCVIEVEGAAGSAPCLATVYPDDPTTPFSTGVPASTSYVCNVANAVYCDSDTSTCLADKPTGASCVEDDECGVASTCDFLSGTCALRGSIGADCVETSDCVSTAYCAGSTCSALLSGGAPCQTSDSCSSADCYNGACVAIATNSGNDAGAANPETSPLALYCSEVEVGN